MTFYNIIFGILFLASIRQVILLAGTPPGWTAACIAVLVFNDTLNTSHLMERPHPPRYTMGMKILDLLNFLLLCFSLIALKPTDNPFGAKPPAPLESLMSESTAWLALSLFWGLSLLWNWLARLYGAERYPLWLQVISHVVILLPLTMTIIS